MRKAKFIPNMGYVLNRLRFEDGNDEGREKCDRGKCGVRNSSKQAPFQLTRSSILN
jgi:hypothetical protein